MAMGLEHSRSGYTKTELDKGPITGADVSGRLAEQR